MARIFISYSHRNKRMAQKLAARLRESGHYPWIDSEQILVGDSVTGTIERAVQECDYLCFLVTRDFLESKWTRKEVNTALSREIRADDATVLPLLAGRSLKVSDLPSFLAEKRFADFRTSFDRGFDELIRAIEQRRGHSSRPIIDSIVFLRHVMRDAVKIIRRKFPNYKISAIRDDRNRCIKEWFDCSGDPGWCEVFWYFDLRKKRETLAGPSRVTAELNPIWDIVMEGFPGVKEIMVFRVPPRDAQPAKRITVRNVRCTVLDAEIVLFDKR